MQKITGVFVIIFISYCILLGIAQGQNLTEVVEPEISKSNSTVSEGKTKRTCACDDTNESLICANNGITYKNNCRFDCAKARVNRLRIVRQGLCSQSGGTGAYWQKGFKGKR